ncbi:hypothetical protein K7X08_031890 [Anisodus acutangulus]|uniref:Uncharacterized protein n=1 Tax=Anisodus acutangulus TaxID=402998 RepID=A0A9Q1MQI4_9SOLA|nr:hypothetical protein K7X08_031890 [Anisodus acutangulus]
MSTDSSSDFEEYIAKAMQEIIRTNEMMITKLQENTQTINKLVEAIQDFSKLKILQKETPQRTLITIPPVQQKTFVPFSSKLATMPSAIPSTSSPVSMADNLKYRPEVINAYEKINKFYDYKTNPDIIITRSTELMMESFDKGIYGIQILDASTDLKGKPIVICQIFKTGRNSTISGDDKNLNMKIPCTLEKFQNWISEKRVFGLLTLKSRIEDMLRNRKASVIGTSKGGDVEEIMTLYYGNDIEVKETTELTLLLDKITNLKHTHAEETICQFKIMAEQKKRPMIKTETLSSAKVSIKKEQSPDPFE